MTKLGGNLAFEIIRMKVPIVFLRRKMEYPEHELLSSEQQDPNVIENQSHNK